MDQGDLAPDIFLGNQWVAAGFEPKKLRIYDTILNDQLILKF